MRKGLGGGMRQAGVLAAAAMFSLDHIAPRLHLDNQRANQIAGGRLHTTPFILFFPFYI